MGNNFMLCTHPTDYGHGPAACGQCTNCRINHKLRWMGRMALEQRYSFPGAPGAFITLTYDDRHLGADRSLKRSDLQLFWDSVRRKIGYTARYFAVGEYGSKTFRPHFHIIHFGAFGNEAWTRVYKECWPNGYIQVGSAEGAVHNYVTGYVTKKLDQMHQGSIEALGLVPEFFSCSRRPTLGSSGITAMAHQINTDKGSQLIAEHGFPRGFNLGGRYYPLFRRDRLRLIKESGYSELINDECLQKAGERSAFWLEELEVYRAAQAFSWPSHKLTEKLTLLKHEQDQKASEAEISRARAHAAKFRRRAAAEKHTRTLDG